MSAVVLGVLLWLSIPCAAQLTYNRDGRGYNCTDVSSSPTSTCTAYVLYRAQAGRSSINRIAALFQADKSQVATINKVPINQEFATGNAVLVPVKCGCPNNTQYANISYTILQGDDLNSIATTSFESLSSVQAIENANPNSFLYLGLPAGEINFVPIYCACPSTFQRLSNVSSLVTYAVKQGDSVDQISSHFGVPSFDIQAANELILPDDAAPTRVIRPETIWPETTLLIPINTSLPTLNMTFAPAPLSSSGPVQLPLAWLGNSSAPGISTGAVVGIAVGISAVALLGIEACCFLLRIRLRKRKASTEKGPNQMLETLDPGTQRFSFEALRNATNDFSDRELLGKGGFGSVYRGTLQIGGKEALVAVKRISAKSTQGAREFLTEVKIIGQARHRNLVRLLGWCDENLELLLVYEYMPNRSVDKHLFVNIDGNCELTWDRRLNIVTGVATGLAYLHGEWEHRVIHRDVKCSNIMLDENFNPRLGDFGLARLYDHDHLPLSTVVAGTFGYLAPELCYGPTFKASEKTDVYAFGVMVLELATGKKSIQEDETLVDLVWGHLTTSKLLGVADGRIENTYDGEEMTRLLKMGLLCCHPAADQRPNMREFLSIWKGSQPVPTVPLIKPVPIFPREESSAFDAVSCNSTFSGDT